MFLSIIPYLGLDTAKCSFLQNILEMKYMLGDEILEKYRFLGVLSFWN